VSVKSKRSKGAFKCRSKAEDHERKQESPNAEMVRQGRSKER